MYKCSEKMFYVYVGQLKVYASETIVSILSIFPVDDATTVLFIILRVYHTINITVICYLNKE